MGSEKPPEEVKSEGVNQIYHGDENDRKLPKQRLIFQFDSTDFDTIREEEYGFLY